MKKLLLIILIIAALGGAYYWFFIGAKSGDISNHLEMVQVGKGNVIKKISSNGTIQPRNQVDVGTQVSGIIEKIYVDFNDEVKKNQLIATLDTYTLQEEVNEKDAALKAADVKLKIAKLNHERNQQLFKEGYISQTEAEEYEVAYSSALSSRSGALAAFNKAKRNLGYAQITSPVDGTVVDKQVEVGQTVAASFSTPTLFAIAEDLTKMQIETSVSEADIGMIKNGMPVTFTVDAYPADEFSGEVGQIRLNPTNESNVVIYTVVINIENKDKKLLPGMTAFVDIHVARRDNVLVIPKSALQFKLPANLKGVLASEPPKPAKYQEAVVYRLEKGKILPLLIETGLSDDRNIEIVNGLTDNESIISEYLPTGNKGTKTRPHGPRM